MIKLFAVVSLMVLAGCAQANNYEEMYRNSFVSDCRGYVCTDTDTGDTYDLPRNEPPRNGSVINFSQLYTTEQIQAAMPYILKRYRGEQDE